MPTYKTDGTEYAYVYGPTGLFAMRVNSAWYYVLRDHLGSTKLLVNSSGTAVSRYEYDPYGKIVDSYVNAEGKFLFTGQELETSFSSTSLWNFRARGYDSEIGLFYEVDPAHQTYSALGYVGGNPISFVDPTGRELSVSNTPPPYDDGRSSWGRSDYRGVPEMCGADGLMFVEGGGGGGAYDGSGSSDEEDPQEKKTDVPQAGGVGVGQPGTWEAIIPIWGSGRAAIDDFQNGNYWSGIGYSALAISDVFLVKSIATAVGRGAWKLGAHSWPATRAWLVGKGYAEAGQRVHHWAISQATGKKYGLEAIANQPWNLMTFSSQSLHMRAGHGLNYLGQQGYGVVGQLWSGTPTWPKALVGSYGGRLIGE